MYMIIRLVDRVYPDHSSIDDYITLLRAKQHEQANPNPEIRNLRITSAVLKKEIGENFYYCILTVFK